MKKLFTGLILALIFAFPQKAKADFWGGDIPLLIEIVANTLHTLEQLQQQTRLMNDELRGINEKIRRIKTIERIIRPEEWKEWRDPREAVNRLRKIYYTLPKEYRTEKSDEIERELSRAMSLASQLSDTAKTTFDSGKQMEERATGASPGVAQKLTASGVGTLVALQSQNQVAQAQIISLLSQSIAETTARQSQLIVSKATHFNSLSTDISAKDSKFSEKARLGEVKP